MNKNIYITILSALLFSSTLIISVSIAKPSIQALNQSASLVFTENKGQWPEYVLFRAKAKGATLWFTGGGFYHQFLKRNDESRLSAELPMHKSHGGRDSVECRFIKMTFIDANKNTDIRGDELLNYNCNYFLGNDANKWRRNVPNYKSIIYNELYPGIDVRYYAGGSNMEYDIIISPGADPSPIKMRYDGVRSLAINKTGNLIIETDWNMVTEFRPRIYQSVKGQRQSIDGDFILLGENVFGININGAVNPNVPLVVDPVIIYGTYLGGNEDDECFDIAVDSDGNAYITGRTYSTDFPLIGPYQSDPPPYSYCHAYISKLNSEGTDLIYSTYIGGEDWDMGYGIELDISGNVYITGSTFSQTFPTVNAFQSSLGKRYGGDAFISKLNQDGNDLIYSTYLGGWDGEEGMRIAVDTQGCAYVTGYTQSENFPVENAFETDYGGGLRDAFLTKLNPEGNGLVYSTFLGHIGWDEGYGVAVDGDGCAYVVGFTSSAMFPRLNALYPVYHTSSRDAFLTKFSSSGNQLVYSTFLGGNGSDHAWAVDVDSEKNPCVAGITVSDDFPTVNPIQTCQDSADVFLIQLDSSGGGPLFSTYLGGNDKDYAHDMVYDTDGNIYIAGRTQSLDFPTVDAIQDTYNGGTWDAFAVKIYYKGDVIIYSTYLGGDNWDAGWSVDVDNDFNAYYVGWTGSTDFPITDGYQTDQPGWDGFIIKIGEQQLIICGDANGDELVNILDISYIIEFLYQEGPAPVPLESADVNSSLSVNILDVTYLINYLYKGGPEPNCP